MTWGIRALASLGIALVIFPGDVRAEDSNEEARAASPGVMVHSSSDPPDIEVVIEARPASAPEDPGTHFIVELNMGTSFTGSVGLAGSLLVGAGGRLRGFPPIFYLVGEAGFQLGGSDGQIDGAHYVDAREYADLSLGLRTYVPVHRDLRIFVDLLPGATFVTSSLARDGFTALHTSGWYAHFGIGGGVAARVFRELSVGVRVRVLLTDDGLDDAREALGIHTPAPLVLSGAVTWHL